MSSPTIKDVAKLAGVSISTVSRVMNDSKPVSPEARRKVLDAIEKLDFKPNELARSLVMKKIKFNRRSSERYRHSIYGTNCKRC